MSQLYYRPKSGMLYKIKYFLVLLAYLIFYTSVFILSDTGAAFALTAHRDFADISTQSNCLSSSDGSPTTGCHSLHEAPEARLQRIKTDSVDLLSLQDEKEVCFTCHDGTVSDYVKTKQDFGNNYGDKASAHNIFDPENPGFVLCSDCHTSHMVPDEGEPAGGWKGNEVVGLLRVLVSNIWYYLVNPDNVAWIDETEKKQLVNPGDFCGGCHQINNQYFSNSLHDTALTMSLSNRPTSSTSTMIKCNVCHQWHGADNEKMLSSTVNGVTVAANDNSLCYSCHTEPAEESAYQGKALFETTKHFTVTSSTVASVNSDSSYDAGYCHNCHNPHGTQYNDFRRGQNELCFTCHDDIGKTFPSGYSYRGQTTYAISAHADASDANTIWPSTAYTGDVLGGGGGAVAGECINCHAPMGRDDGGGTRAFSKLLVDAAVDGDSNEQNICFGGNSVLGKCHAKSYTYSDDSDTFYSKPPVNVYDDFNFSRSGTGPNSGATVNARHDITKADQDSSGAKVECLNCHNTHINNRSYDFNENKSRVADPDNTANNYSTEYSPAANFSNSQPFRTTADDRDSSFGVNMLNYTNYCLKCHDNDNLPGDVTMGATVPTDILSSFGNSTTANADKHGRGDGTGANLKFPYYGSSGQSGSTTEAYSAMNCTDCHDSHGSNNLYHLKTTISINGTVLTSPGGTTVTNNTYGDRTGWCMTCHLSPPDSGPDDHTPAGYDDCGSCHYHGSNF